MVAYSICQIIGDSSSKCGYCGRKEEELSNSFGVWMHQLSIEKYQQMLNKGWRRSGKYLYKPSISTTCCPAYTIRLDATKFKISKGQAKVLKKMQKYIQNGGDMSIKVRNIESDEADIPTELVQPSTEAPKLILISPDITNQKKLKREEDAPEIKEPTTPIFDRTTGIYNLIQNAESHNQNSKHKLTTVLEPAAFTMETFDLYKKYQIEIHNDKTDDINPEGYTRFLIDSPLINDPENSQFGTFHLKYYVDDKLIAVSYLDILPECVSAIYFVYDTDFGKLSLGTFSALKELGITCELNLKYPEIKYYYMGYYIHSCGKMKYKAQFKPSELLCPVF
jgi:arginine-tRNA-protein transferase